MLILLCFLNFTVLVCCLLWVLWFIENTTNNSAPWYLCDYSVRAIVIENVNWWSAWQRTVYELRWLPHYIFLPFLVTILRENYLHVKLMSTNLIITTSACSIFLYFLLPSHVKKIIWFTIPTTTFQVRTRREMKPTFLLIHCLRINYYNVIREMNLFKQPWAR